MLRWGTCPNGSPQVEVAFQLGVDDGPAPQQPPAITLTASPKPLNPLPDPKATLTEGL